ncbi:MAG: pilus assembly protein PilM [Deltaproteobacteria bacterium]|nr:pilus assembly protein PilM [Deltaproteobacteria bacterium]
MAYRVIGLDLGSHSVKAMALNVGLRGAEPTLFEVEPVELDDDGRSTMPAILAAAGRLAKRLAAEGEPVHVALPGERVSTRVVRLPMSAARRLEQVLKFELDDTLPFDIDDAVFDHVEVARDGEGITVVAAAVPSGEVKALVDGLTEQGVGAQEVGVAPLSYGALLAAGKKKEEAAASKVTAFIDLGHERTNVAVLGDRVPTFRTILRGGRDLTAVLAEKGKVAFAEAEAYKQRDGLTGRVGDVLREALRPLVREIRQTLAGHQAAGGRPVERIILAGGGAGMRGIDQLLADEVGVAAETFHFSMDDVHVSDRAVAAPAPAALAYALALRETIPKARRMNLRRGELVFKGDRALLKKRALWMGVCVLGILLSWMFASYAQYRSLKVENEASKAKLEEVTKRLFRRPILEKEEIERELGGETVEEAPVPAKDAFDIVVEISRRIPTSVVHDVEDLEIKPKRITIRGIVDPELKTEGAARVAGDGGADESAGQLSPTDLIQQKLSEWKECFTTIRMGRVQADEMRKRYQMDIESKCP